MNFMAISSANAAFLKALHYQSWRLKFGIAVIRGTKNQRQENFSYVLSAQHNNSMPDESHHDSIFSKD
jgi:hypothetical protein